jgi:biotin synthase
MTKSQLPLPSKTQDWTVELLLDWLRKEDDAKLARLWLEADRVRREHAGDEVHLRGLIELSNFCRRDCHYCGIRGSRRIERYRVTEGEAMECARLAIRLEYGTVVLQAGEDPGLTCESISRLVSRIKAETTLAVTLSLGERSPAELAEWREAGADRYLLRHETSDIGLFHRIHPPAAENWGQSQGGDTSTERRGECVADVSPAPASDSARYSPRSPGLPNARVELLKRARELGYEIGSGVMVGIPGQSYESLADDILLFRELDLEMIGCGPYVAHPDTPLGGQSPKPHAPGLKLQVPNTDVMTTKVIALSRLVCPDANIPATTALATVNSENGRELGLERGANVWMPNLTPLRYRSLYEIYPGKACVNDTAEACQACLLQRIRTLGRVPGKGPGGRRSPPRRVTLLGAESL